MRRIGTDLWRGIGLFGRGTALFFRSGPLVLLGMLPAVMVLAVFALATGVLLYFLSDLSALVTWFADDWSTPARTAMRVVAGTSIVVGAGALMLVTYVALTLVVGDPFYEAISKRIEERVGGASAGSEPSWYLALWRSLADSVRLVALSVVFGMLALLLGLVPFVGQTVVPVLEAGCGGFLLAVEFSGPAWNRRGLRLPDRRRLLWAHRWVTVGFGTPVFLALLVPFAAVVVVPAAVAGATLLIRELLAASPQPADS